MRLLLLTTSVFVMMALPNYGQSSYQRNNVYIGGGAAVPTGVDTAYLGTAPQVSFGYGYRFNRLLQADLGFQIAFGAAHNQNAEVTDFGTVQGGDREYMLPIGGRVYLPLHLSRLEASLGGGIIHLHYSETGPSGSAYGYQSSCYTCTSRGGWGGYGLGNLSYYLDEGRTFHVGTTYEFVAGSTHGSPVANIPAIATTDHWSMISLEFGLSF